MQMMFVGMLLAFWSSRALAADSLVLNQARLGNIFLSTETVEIPVQITGDPVDAITWTAKDFFGVPTTGPIIPVPANGQVVVLPGLGRPGYFDLRVTALRGGSPVASADTTFAVVTPSNVSTMNSSQFGAMTHFAHGWTTEILQLLARGGVAHFRDEQYWSNVEPALTTPLPTYTFTEYQPYMTTAAALGLKPLLILDFANPNYDSGFSPYTEAGRTGYANYAKALLTQYGTQIDSVAIWNEYNGTFSTGPAIANRAFYYTEMLKTAFTAIKAQRPDVRVVGGACVPVPIPWYEDLFAYGALDYMDVIDAHPYRSIPEGVENNLATLQNLSASYNRGNGPKPIWATECGAPDPANQGRQNMSRYLVRLMTLMLSAGVERAYWYLAYDYDGYATGLVRSPTDPLGPYVPSSAFPAYSNLIQQLYGAIYVGRENTDARTRFYRFNRGGSDLRIVWSTLGTAQLVLTTSSPLTRINIMGESTVLQPTNGKIALTADETPFYLIGPIDSVREIGRDLLVADSERDFSGTQGGANGTWAYGNAVIPLGSAYNTSLASGMTYTRTLFDSFYSSAYSFAKLDTNGGHPSATLNQSPVHPVWTVRRWHSNFAGNARITGTIVRASVSGDGTGARIYVNNTLVYSTLAVGASTVSFDFTTPIQIGAKLDLTITPGPGVDVDFDYIDFRAQISKAASPPTTFTAWQEQNFTAAEIIDPTISGDNAAPAGDGVDNLIKYSASVSPKTFAAAALPVVGQQTIGADTYLTLSYRRTFAAADLVFTPQLNAGDLASDPWLPGGILVGPPVTNPDGTQTFTYRDEVPITPANPGRFMRLRITR